MAPEAADRLAGGGFGKVWTSDSIPACSAPWLEVVSVVPLLARTIRYLRAEDPGRPET